MRAIADVVRVMIDAVRDGKVINLNAVKNEAARRYGLKRSPKLVELVDASTLSFASTLCLRSNTSLTSMSSLRARRWH